jgi:hypothetical protein
MMYGTFIEGFGEFSKELTFLARACEKNDTNFINPSTRY